jgi:hypothetical protein
MVHFKKIKAHKIKLVTHQLQGGTINVQGYPGWSRSPNGKEFNKDTAWAPKSTPIEVGEGLDDGDMHTTQDDSGEGGLSKQIAVSFGGKNPDGRLGSRKL